MTEALPHGIVFNTHSIRSELNHDSHVEVEDVARLWRGEALPLFISSLFI